MSMFTADPKALQPPCERCKKPQFVALVARTDDHSVWDCRWCGPVVNKPEGAPKRKPR